LFGKFFHFVSTNILHVHVIYTIFAGNRSKKERFAHEKSFIIFKKASQIGPASFPKDPVNHTNIEKKTTDTKRRSVKDNMIQISIRIIGTNPNKLEAKENT